MAVKRIVPDLATEDPEEARVFYQELLDLDLVMNQGWIVTLASDATTTPQLSLAREGGSGAPVPDLSIEVDDVDHVHEKALTSGYEIVYDLCDEPWGVRRFFVRDPAGKILNILAHTR